MYKPHMLEYLELDRTESLPIGVAYTVLRFTIVPTAYASLSRRFLYILAYAVQHFMLRHDFSTCVLASVLVSDDKSRQTI
jgi:hypothetical protein